MTLMSDAGLIQRVRLGWEDSERMQRYFEKLARRMQWWQRVLATALVVAAGGTVTPLLTPLPELVTAVAAVLVALLTVWTIVAKYETKATLANFFWEQYGDLKMEWRRLWYEGASAAEVWRLEQLYMDIPKGHDLVTDDRLNKQAFKEAQIVVELEFNNREEESASVSTGRA